MNTPSHRPPTFRRSAPEATVVIDAVFANQDQEYLDAIALQRLHTKAQ